MGKTLETRLAVVASHTTLPNTTERQVRIGIVHHTVVDTATSKRNFT